VDFSIILCLLPYLFVCTCDFTCFPFLTILINNKVGKQGGVMVASGTFGFRDT
jgi:hypothetical protein